MIARRNFPDFLGPRETPTLGRVVLFLLALTAQEGSSRPAGRYPTHGLLDEWRSPRSCLRQPMSFREPLGLPTWP
jgi:hypothetical protein